jgi:hypothetical protein
MARNLRGKAKEVSKWILDEDLSNDIAKVYVADTDNAFFTVKVDDGSNKIRDAYFFGEMAWADARRYADDHYWRVLYSR